MRAIHEPEEAQAPTVNRVPTAQEALERATQELVAAKTEAHSAVLLQRDLEYLRTQNVVEHADPALSEAIARGQAARERLWEARRQVRDAISRAEAEAQYSAREQLAADRRRRHDRAQAQHPELADELAAAEQALVKARAGRPGLNKFEIRQDVINAERRYKEVSRRVQAAIVGA